MPGYEGEGRAVKKKPGAYRGLKATHGGYLRAVEARGQAVREAAPLE